MNDREELLKRVSAEYGVPVRFLKGPDVITPDLARAMQRMMEPLVAAVGRFSFVTATALDDIKNSNPEAWKEHWDQIRVQRRLKRESLSAYLKERRRGRK